jgi:hypothetical protein
VGTERYGWRQDAALILLLLLAGAGVKAWLVRHTVVLARDGIGYIRFAASLREEPWADVLRRTQQHPLYPISILAVAPAVEAWQGRSDCLTWQLAAQLANGILSTAIVVPMYLMGRSLFSRQAGFWSALLFQVLPVQARVTADALSEGTFLFWAATALLFLVWGLQQRRAAWFLLGGAAGSLSYLARPEGALVIALAGLILVAWQLRGRWGGTWKQALACGSCLAAGSILLAAPYWATIGGLSVKPSATRMLETSEGPAASPQAALPRGVLFAARFMPGTNGEAEGNDSPWYALYEVLDETCKGFHYVAWAPALLGLVLNRRRIWTEAGLALVAGLGVVFVFVLWRLAWTVQYVSERHTLLIVLCGCPLAVAAVFDIGRRWQAWKPAAEAAAGATVWQRWRRPQALALTVVVALTGAALLRTMRPLHAHRAGHKEAGFWLAAHLGPGDNVVDPYGWASFYSGQTLLPRHANKGESRPDSHRFLVVELTDQDGTRNKMIEQAAHGTGKGEPIFTWPRGKPPALVVYRAPNNLPGTSQ